MEKTCKKIWKVLAVLAAAGIAVGIIIAWFCKKKSKNNVPTSEGTAEEDNFTIEDDLKATEDREYVSLTKPAEETSGKESPEKESSEKETSEKETSEKL